jgi:hypothetical protein
MIESRVEELIQLEIDGQNSPESSAQLAAILESDPEARSCFERLRAMAEELGELGLDAVPPELREGIEDRLSRHRGEGPMVPPRTRRPRRGLAPREIFAFASGIAAGIAFFAFLGQGLWPGEELDPTSLGGSMVLNPHAGVLPVVDRRTLESDGLRAEVLIRSDPDFVVAEIDLSNPQDLQMVLEFDLAALALVGCERPTAAEGEVVLGSSRLEIRDPQEGPYRFVFRKRAEHASSPLLLRLERGAWSAQESLGITPAGQASPG